MKRSLRRSPAFSVVVLVVAAVLQAGSPAAVGRTKVPVSPPSLPPLPQPATAVVAAVSHDESISFEDGLIRVHVPRHPTGVGVVVLHSLGNSAAEPARQGWSDASDRHGFVGIYPDRGISWNAGLCCGEAALEQRDDVGWLARAIQEVERRYDLTTVWLAGFSNGGMMAETLVAQAPLVSSRLAVWGAAPEMPGVSGWRGRGDLFTGVYDDIVPARGGRLIISGTWELIRPQRQSSRFLPHAVLTTHDVPGYGHPVPPDWPERAWLALSGLGGPSNQSSAG